MQHGDCVSSGPVNNMHWRHDSLLHLWKAAFLAADSACMILAGSPVTT